MPSLYSRPSAHSSSLLSVDWARKVIVARGTAMLPYLPPEILDLITDHLRDEPTTLEACCLVSKSWVPRTRRHLFAHVKFGPFQETTSLEWWMTTFPDPSNSPAHYTCTLEISTLTAVKAATTHRNAWVRSFNSIVTLEVNTEPWGGFDVSLVRLHRLSANLKSLCFNHPSFNLIQVISLACSFPLLEDFLFNIPSDLARDLGDATSTPPTSPKLTRSLVLRGQSAFITRRLLDLPGGLHFAKITMQVRKPMESVVNLVSRCSHTLESLSLDCSFQLESRLPPLDFSDAEQLENVEFSWSLRNVWWITASLQTVKSKYLRQITIEVCSARFYLPQIDVLLPEWEDLNRLSSELWISRSVLPKIKYYGAGYVLDLGEIAPIFLPELTKRLHLVASLSTLSKSWLVFMTTKEFSIYRSISKRYGCTSEDGEDSAGPPGGWKAWSIRKFQTELRWVGKLPGNPYMVTLLEDMGNFYGIKLDEEAGYVINTFIEGGLVVSDISDHRILWSLEEEFRPDYVHCDYDDGYLVLNLYDHCKVWRRRIDVLDIPDKARPSRSQNGPDDEMVKGNRIAEGRYLDASRSRDPNHLRGQFAPWASLVLPDQSRIFKLAQGTLLVSSGFTAFIYDIEKAELQQTIESEKAEKSLKKVKFHVADEVRYVDFSDQHILVVRALRLYVYDWETGLLVLRIPAKERPWDLYARPENQWEFIERRGELSFRQAVRPNLNDRDDFNHLVILTLSFRVILIQDFWRLLPVSPSSSPTSVPSLPLLKDISKQIDFYIEPPLVQRDGLLAYHRGRVAVVRTYGIYVLNLDSILDQLGEIALPTKDDLLENPPNSAECDPSWPDLRLTETKLYLSVFPKYFRDKRDTHELVMGHLRDETTALETPWLVKRSWVVPQTRKRLFTLQLVPCLQLVEMKLYLSVFLEGYRANRWGDDMWFYDFAPPPLFV
ncbi:hypothetical protein BJ322DRAFT_1017897 [Thelephora terrestris]|uniref:F-box domain-containing protein n=1 Tax=Thelephora terrestris TaxID=56493 RepID=A0A9P6HKR2_9AGAM|nr:hypothetical protein BJ322DRAFT_1017897 [Thelephora terrestris]